MTDKDRALYAGGALCALVVGGLMAKLVLHPLDAASSRPAMQPVASLGKPDAFGSGDGAVTPPSFPTLAAEPPPARATADIGDPPSPAPKVTVEAPSPDPEAAAPSGQDASATVTDGAGADAEPGRPGSEWGRTYAVPPERKAYYGWRRPVPPPRRAYDPPRYADGSPRYEYYGPPPPNPRPWDAGAPPGADKDEPD